MAGGGCAAHALDVDETGPAGAERRAIGILAELRQRDAELVGRGEPEGTRFPPHEARYSSFKLWLKYAKPSRGTLLIDAGAMRAVREGSRPIVDDQLHGGLIIKDKPVPGNRVSGVRDARRYNTPAHRRISE